MPYRRTENVVRRLAQREETILAAAQALATEGGMAAVQIASVAERAKIAAGTVYRYFPSKTDLVAELIAGVAGHELEAVRVAGDAAPGPLSALAGSIATFAARALQERRLIWAAIGEPVDADVDAMRLDFRQSLAAEFERRIAAAIDGASFAGTGRGRRRGRHRRRADGRLDRPAGADARRQSERTRGGAGGDIAGFARARRGRCPRPRAGGAMRVARLSVRATLPPAPRRAPASRA